MTARVPLRKLAPESLTERQRAVYDAITSGPRSHGPSLFRTVDDAGALEGPFNAFLLQPRLGHALQSLGAAIRYETTMTDRAREIAILLVAAHWDSEFERYSHEAIGEHVGLTAGELTALRDGRCDVFTDPIELVTAQAVIETLRSGDLTDQTYASATELLGEPGLFEVLTLVGYYATLAMQLRVFRVPTPDDPPPT